MKQIKEQITDLKSGLSKTGLDQIDLKAVEEQLELFINGVRVPRLIKACRIGDGIVRIDPHEFNELYKYHSEALKNLKLTKFVPASGAASRMFQKLQSILNRFDDFTMIDLETRITDDNDCRAVYHFLSNLEKFAFYDDLKSFLNNDEVELKRRLEQSPKKILKLVLLEPGLNYVTKPKGAVKFHRYGENARTPFEEHIIESLKYMRDDNGKVNLHFTISEEHKNLFDNIIEEIKKKSDQNITPGITFSFQKRTTDTIAVDERNNILFDKSGNLIRRPGGHGALIENLNDLDADIVIIKNIDNISVEKFSDDTVIYKKLLIGYLCKIRNKIFNYLCVLENKADSNVVDEIAEFASQYLYITRPQEFDDWDLPAKQKFYFNKLNRPIRVCGMVKNQGEPGGGPFWIKDEDENLSLQIIEQAQINLNDSDQKNIFKGSTHFNPVDLVCAIKDYKNNKFDLRNFVDHKSGIITKKSKDGVELKALELPGLWNAGMANWITIFVEVPVSTFNPVKEVNDLLRKEHQN